MTKSKHIVDLILIFFLFVIMRIWLAWFSGNPVGVDAWDYMSWIKKSYSSQSLMHAPLHVPGFYAFISMIAIYTGIDIFVLYTYLLPFLGAIIFWLSLQPLFKTHKLYALFFTSIFGFLTLRTSMIIPEWLGLIIMPSAIISILLLIHQYRQSNHHILSYTAILGVIASAIIFSHHLSGGIIVLVIWAYALIIRKKGFYLVAILLSIEAFYLWGIAGGFPLRMFVLFLDIAIFPLMFLAVIFPILVWKRKTISTGIARVYHSLYLYTLSPDSVTIISLVLTIVLIIIGFSIDAPFGMILYWFPASTLVFLSLLAFTSDKYQDLKDSLVWPASIFFLHVAIALPSIVRPLLARLFIFQIQALLPLLALGLSIAINAIVDKKNSRSQFLSLFVILLTLLTIFHSYPNSDAWFMTEFRYYDDEVEMAALFGRWMGDLPENFTIDTDNRFGVMLRGVTLIESTYGEYVASWLTATLTNKDFAIPDAIIINHVMQDIGFMTGKFIHGQGGGAKQVAIAFDPSIISDILEFGVKVSLAGRSCLYLMYL